LSLYVQLVSLSWTVSLFVFSHVSFVLIYQ